MARGSGFDAGHKPGIESAHIGAVRLISRPIGRRIRSVRPATRHPGP
jgi:hypothetical protein